MTSVGTLAAEAGLAERGRTVAGRGGEADGFAAGEAAPSACTALGGEYGESALDGTPAYGSVEGRASTVAVGAAGTERAAAGEATTAGIGATTGGIDTAAGGTDTAAGGNEAATGGNEAPTGGNEAPLVDATEALGPDAVAKGVLAAAGGNNEGRGATAEATGGAGALASVEPRKGEGVTAGGSNEALTVGVRDAA